MKRINKKGISAKLKAAKGLQADWLAGVENLENLERWDREGLTCLHFALESWKEEMQKRVPICSEFFFHIFT